MAQPIQYIIDGDLLRAREQVIVNPVNCRGVMGAGLALAFKQRYPKMYRAYKQQCESGELKIGQLCLYTESQPWILNFPTKDHYRQPSRLIYIHQGLEHLISNWQRDGIESIAFPKLGCGKGGLSWDEVGPLMAQTLAHLPIPTTIYIDKGDREY